MYYSFQESAQILIMILRSQNCETMTWVLRCNLLSVSLLALGRTFLLSQRTVCRQNETVGMDYITVSRRTVRRQNEAVGMHYARVSRRTLCRQNEAVGMDYVGVSGRRLCRSNYAVGMHNAVISQRTACRQNEDALRRGFTEHNAQRKSSGRHALFMGFAEVSTAGTNWR